MLAGEDARLFVANDHRLIAAIKAWSAIAAVGGWWRRDERGRRLCELWKIVDRDIAPL